MQNKINTLRILIISDTRMVRKKLLTVPVSQNKKLESTSVRLYKIAKSKGIDTYLCKLNGAYFSHKKNNKIYIHNESDKKGFELNKSTVVIVRGAINQKKSYLALISELENIGVSVINSRKCIEACSDKYLTYVLLKKENIKQPKTLVIQNDSKESLKLAVKKLQNKFPIILKTLQGSKGVGVILIESYRSLPSIVQMFSKIDNNEILLQEYIDTKFDIRVIVLNNKIIAAIKRVKITNDFRSNISQGSKAYTIKLTKLEKETCIRAAMAVDGKFVGVDFIPSSNRVLEKPYVLEVNHSPGTQGISLATRSEICEDIINAMIKLNYSKAQIKNYTTEKKICGIQETIVCDGENMIAKMDTGNSASACALDVDNLEINKKIMEVKFSRKGKWYTKKIKKFIKLLKPNTIRPVIECEIKFLDKIYIQDVSLDQRNKIPFLANIDFMKKLGVIINPNEKFKLTKKEKISIK